MILIPTIIIAVLAVIILGWIVFIYSFTGGLVKTFLRGEAPFVPTKSAHLPKIAECMRLDERSTLCDLGCGDARVLVACYNVQPDAKFIGFERDILPFAWSKFRLWAMGLSKKIKIIKKDFFKGDLSSATHIFLYLGPNQMRKLAPILEREIKKGKKIASLQFEIPDRAAEKIVNLGKEDLYIY